MIAVVRPTSFGCELTADDYHALNKRAIPADLADLAGIRRVDSLTAREMFGRKRGDLAGLIIPNILPGEPGPREYRLRLDHPELEYKIDGTTRERAKYLHPPERRNLIYFPAGVQAPLLMCTQTPVVITEGEFKSLALWNVANCDSSTPRFLPVSLPGVWNWRGTIGRTSNSKGERVDVKGVIPDIERINWKDRQVIVAYDADIEKNAQVRAARWQLTAALMERGAVVGYLEWAIGEGKGIDDRIANVGPDRILEEIARVEFGDWRQRLLRGHNGRLLPCYDNAALMLENSPEWASVIGFNEFSCGHFVLAKAPSPITAEVGREIEDQFDTETVRWFERRGVMVKPEVARRVIDIFSRRTSYHPVREYLESLPEWDGQRRIGSWLIDYCGVESSDTSPNHFAMSVGAKFLISAVARIFEPGCKVDHTLILEGAQGIGKSTVVRTLAGDQWFTDQLGDMGTKDASMQLRGMWMIELSELDVLSRAEMARAKAFLTQQVERFRLPYGKRLVHVPRQCVFVGTTNCENWLKDETGGRRFWPVRCQQAIDLAGLARDRDQIWAEALRGYRAGVSWWLEDRELIEDAMAEQQARYDTDVWQERIEAWLEDPAQRSDELGHPLGEFQSTKTSVSLDDVLSHCIGKRPDQWTQGDKLRISRCLTALGWRRRRRREGRKSPWRYEKAGQ